jgi:bifunctional non-homologous end joining protein LigD
VRGIRFNEHLEAEDGESVFRHACKLGLEGIVSKREASPYRSGRSPDWLKMKNPAAVRRG